jgi:hypothetical protein
MRDGIDTAPTSNAAPPPSGGRRLWADAVLGESERLELIRLREQVKNHQAAIAEL